jgi:predicted enzyme related to lactoylglutathione lyase
MPPLPPRRNSRDADWQWPNQNLVGHAIDFYTNVLGASFKAVFDRFNSEMAYGHNSDDKTYLAGKHHTDIELVASSGMASTSLMRRSSVD